MTRRLLRALRRLLRQRHSRMHARPRRALAVTLPCEGVIVAAPVAGRPPWELDDLWHLERARADDTGTFAAICAGEAA